MAASYFVYVMSMTYKHFAYFQIVKDLIRSYIIAEGQAIPVIVNNIKLIFAIYIISNLYSDVFSYVFCSETLFVK